MQLKWSTVPLQLHRKVDVGFYSPSSGTKNLNIECEGFLKCEVKCCWGDARPVFPWQVNRFRLQCTIYSESARNPVPTRSPNTWRKVRLQIILICYQVMLGFHESPVTEFPNWKGTGSQPECGSHETRLRTIVINMETQLIVIAWSPLLYPLSFLILLVLFVSNSWQHQSGVSQPAGHQNLRLARCFTLLLFLA